jgi:hypothetical protein
MQGPQSLLHPRTANVSFAYEDFGDGCIGRVYYWYDPHRSPPGYRRPRFSIPASELSDTEWKRLFDEALERGETEFAEIL